VYYLETDVGQPGAGIPGVVTLARATRPVLGPHYAVAIDTVVSFFVGHVSPAADSKHYLNCVRAALAHYYKHCAASPLVINTHGWIRGLGLDLITAIIRMSAPQHVIQLCLPEVQCTFAGCRNSVGSLTVGSLDMSASLPATGLLCCLGNPQPAPPRRLRGQPPTKPPAMEHPHAPFRRGHAH
jgi:mRNA cleavage and polyadenylation factor CLP1-like protein